MSPKGNPREMKFTVLLSDEESRMLTELAEDESLSAANVVRRFIKKEHAARFAQKATAKKKR